MKVLVYFSGDLSEPKGTPIRVKSIITGLIKNGADVYYASHYIPKDVELAGSLYVGSKYLRPFRLASFVRKNKIDIFFVITTAGLWVTPVVRLLTSAKIGCDLHSLRIEEEKVYRKLNLINYKILRFVDTLLCRNLHFATGVSAPLGNYYKKVISVYHLFPVGVDLNMFNPSVPPDKEILDWKGDSVLIGYAGNTKWYQGLSTVLEVMVKLDKEKKGLFKLIIVASSLDQSVSDFIEKNNLSGSVRVLGKQSHDKIPSILMSADVLTIVRPRDLVTEYAFPSKLPEHLALGKPLIVSKVGDVDSYIVNGVSAIMIGPNSPTELHSALLKLTDSSLRERLGRGSYELAKSRFDINKLNKSFYDFLLTQVQK